MTDCRAVVSVGGVLDLCDADEEALGGGAGAVARFLGHLRWHHETRNKRRLELKLKVWVKAP